MIHIRGYVSVRPEEYVMVPRKPTEEMLEAAWAFAHDEDAAGVWRAMLSSSPDAAEKEFYLASDVKPLIEELERLRAGWIEIKEGCELPANSGEHGYLEVMVYSPRYPEQHLGRYRTTSKTWTFSGSNSDFTDAITHWRPIPEAPHETSK